MGISGSMGITGPTGTISCDDSASVTCLFSSIIHYMRVEIHLKLRYRLKYAGVAAQGLLISWNKQSSFAG